MVVTGISQVLQRIREIEYKFSPGQAAPVESFEEYMNKAEKQGGQQSNSVKGLKPVEQANGTGGIQGADKAAKSTASANINAPQDMASMIKQSAAKYGVDAKLVDAIAQTESNYRSDAVSEAGAVGVMQLMPDTAASLGVTNSYNVQENIDGGTKYIGELLNTFNGDVKKAVAAYNAGPQAVKNYQGVPPYSETQNYVKKVLDIYR